MLLTIALLAAPAQCPNGVCPAGPVARTARYVASVPYRLTASQVRPAMPLPMPGPGPSTKPAAASKPATAPTAHRGRIVGWTRAGGDRWYLGKVLLWQLR